MVKFELSFILDLQVIQEDREKYNIETLNEIDLRRISMGKILMTDKRANKSIIIESEIFDYLQQLMDVFLEINDGNHATFTVSRDYYSNSLEFTYFPESKRLEIYEGNEGSFRLQVDYKVFQKTFIKFSHRLINHLKRVYPELQNNSYFKKVENNSKKHKAI